MFLSSSNPQAPCAEALFHQGCFAAGIFHQWRNVRSSRTCQHGDWTCWVRRVQAAWAGRLAPGTQVPQPQPLRDYSLLHGPGGPGPRLQTGLSSGCQTCHVSSQPRAAAFAGGAQQCPAAHPGQDSAGNESVRKAKEGLSVLEV